MHGGKSPSSEKMSKSAAQSEALTPVATTPNPQMKAVLDELGMMNGKPIESLSAPEARKQPTPTDAVMSLKKKMGQPTTPPPTVKTSNRQISANNITVPVRVYTPTANPEKVDRPVIVYARGGGWVIATLDTYDASCRVLSEKCDAIVLSVDYRVAPENKFPAAHDDVYAVLQWALMDENAKQVGGTADKVAIVGESAGGNMAASSCLQAKMVGGKQPLAQVLIYPVTGTSTNTPSYTVNANAKPLNKAMIPWFTEKYLGKVDDAQNKRIALLKATQDDLTGLPPATIITASIDPLQSDGAMFADRLKSAGVKTVYRNYPQVTHEFFGMGDVVDAAKDAEAFAVENLGKAFAGK